MTKAAMRDAGRGGARPRRRTHTRTQPDAAGPAARDADAVKSDVLPRPAAVARPLLRWYHRCRRDLPWRRSRDPYRVWVSEVMLQQTQVDRVREYFERFIVRFPTVSALAAAREQEVLRLWEGLGYYRRARQLHAAAKRMVADHGGRLPTTVAELRQLPGIGRYTAGAIASIALGLSEPIVEANSRRVLARLTGYDRPLDGTAGDGPIWEIAARLVPRKDAGLFNQALMDLGALVCTPERPRCDACPLASLCVARQSGRAEAIPVKTSGRRPQRVRELAAVIRRRGRVYLVQRAAGEWWEGLWDFPRLPAAPPASERQRLGTIAYTVTHHQVSCTVIAVPADGRAARSVTTQATGRWVAEASLPRLALPSPARRIAGLLGSASAVW